MCALDVRERYGVVVCAFMYMYMYSRVGLQQHHMVHISTSNSKNATGPPERVGWLAATCTPPNLSTISTPLSYNCVGNLTNF